MGYGLHKPSHALVNQEESSKYGSTGPSLAYPIVEGAGTKIFDGRGSAKTGTFAGGITWGIGAPYGRHVVLDGVNGTHVTIPATAVNSFRGLKRGSVEMIFSTTTLQSGTNYGVLYCEETATAGQDRFALGVTGAGTGLPGAIRLECSSDDAGVTFKTIVTSTFAVTLGTFYHIVASFDADVAANQNIFINGVPRAVTGTGTQPAWSNTNPNTIQIGQFGAGVSRGLNGNVAMCVVWPGLAMTTAQASARYNDPFSLFWAQEEPLVNIAALPIAGGIPGSSFGGHKGHSSWPYTGKAFHRGA